MAIQLTELPYSTDSLESCISQKTLEIHYHKHHEGYANKLNELTQNTPFEKMSLEEIILESSQHQKHQKIFNNAAQTWNHDFYWKCMTPRSTQLLNEDCYTLIRNQFGSFENMKAEFTESAKNVFGSGWTWLVKNLDDTLEIVNTSNADTPLVHQQTPLLTCDLWEHAYYLDYQNERNRYLSGFLKVVNWDFVEDNIYQAFNGFQHGIRRAATSDSWDKNKWQNANYI